jgi:hypothetical protein
MGYLAAVDMANQADIDRALAWHLQSNHYPSIYSVHVLNACKAAIKNANTEQWNKLVRWEEPRFQPKRSVVMKRKRLYVETHELVRICHLEAFLTPPDEDR